MTSFVPARSPEDWIPHLAKGEDHWRAGRSAFEVANAWTPGTSLPPPVQSVFERSSHQGLHGLNPLLVLAEYETKLPGQGPASHSDALCLARGSEGLVAVIVEGKERERFDEPVREWLKKGGENRKTRLRGVCERLGLDPSDVLDIEWQLLHRTAAAVIEAARFGARQAVMLVHSFSAVQQGLPAYQAFLRCFGETGEAGEVTEIGQRGRAILHTAWVADQPVVASEEGSAEQIFLSALDWLGENYRAQKIFNERDIERALQTRMNSLIRTRGLPLRVFHAYPMERGPRRALSVDLAVLDDPGQVQLAIELKYEPAKEREGKDIWAGKFPVTEWAGIEKDLERLRSWVEAGAAWLGYAVLIDEGNRYGNRMSEAETRRWEKSSTGYDTRILVRRVAPAGD